MAQKDIKVAYGIDVDAVAGWLGSYGGEDSPDDISRLKNAAASYCLSLRFHFRSVRSISFCIRSA